MCSKQPAVAIALERLNENAASVAQMLDMLEQRLLPVLRNEPETPRKDESCDGVVPLSQAITASAVSLAKAKERLGSILQRLEL